MKRFLAILLISSGFHLDSVNANPAGYEGIKELPETASADEIFRYRQDLAGAQQQFNTIWSTVLKKFSKQKKFLAELRSEHESWLHFREVMAHTMGLVGTDADFSPKGSSAFMYRKALYTRDRTKWLRGLLENPGNENDLSGVWWSSMGDSIRIEQNKNDIRFTYSAKGGNWHQGFTAGIIQWNAGKGTFTAVWGDSTSADKGTIIFSLEYGLLRTEEKGVVSEAAGTRVSFSNKFTRVAPLSDKDRKRIPYDIQSFGPPNAKNRN